MKKGFTLIEILTAVTVFSIIMTISMGSIIGIFDANRQTRSIKSIMSNLNLAMESMSREARFGRSYHCDDASPSDVTQPLNCPSGNVSLTFLSSDNERITYRYRNNRIERLIAGDGRNYVPITATDVVITDLDFFVLGANRQAPELQPRVIIKVRGYAGVGNKGRSDFTLQTLVSQRVLDF